MSLLGELAAWLGPCLAILAGLIWRDPQGLGKR